LDTPQRFIRRRAWLLLALLSTIAIGLALRRFGYAANLPFAAVKYGGSILWGAMVYWLLATIFVSAKGHRIAFVALIAATAVEFSRLWHTPALDAFRLTTAGALLLGRVFSLWNIAAYAVGIVAALALDRILPVAKRTE
jgi:hypothetical protein